MNSRSSALGALVWLYYLLVSVSAHAAPDLLVDLRSSLLSKNLISGLFLQCTKQDDVIVSASGRYRLSPEERLDLDFEEPKSYSLTYFSNGNVVKHRFAGEDKPRYSSLGNLIFSMVNFNIPVLERYFEIEVSGTREDFLIMLAPKKRVKKLVLSVTIAGAGDLIDSIDIIGADSREVKILFGTDDDLSMSACG